MLARHLCSSTSLVIFSSCILSLSQAFFFFFFFFFFYNTELESVWLSQGIEPRTACLTYTMLQSHSQQASGVVFQRISLSVDFFYSKLITSNHFTGSVNIELKCLVVVPQAECLCLKMNYPKVYWKYLSDYEWLNIKWVGMCTVRLQSLLLL